jgi:uncharacterized protein YkwD
MRTALLACGVVICCLAIQALQPAEASANRGRLDRVEKKVIRIVNRIRARHGLRRLKASRPLAAAATEHTGDMLRRDFLSHASSDGTAMGDRVRRYTGTKHWIGENIVAMSGRATARKAVRLWMHSPPHRAILLSPAGGRIGVGKRRGKLGSAPLAVFTADLTSGG